MTQAATLAQLASSGALSADTSGNVGIGTTSPTAKLDLYNGGSQLKLNMTASGNGFTITNDPSYTLLQTANAVYMAFGTNGAERMRIDALGNVSGIIKSGTTVASTSGTSIDFTGIPSTAKRVTVMFNGLSTNGVTNIQLQLGTSGGVQTTGYTGAWSYNGTSNSGSTATTGFVQYNDAASDTRSGAIVFTLLDLSTGTWACTGQTATSRGFTLFTSGSKVLSGTLDRVRITTVNGTDTFDAGTVNILYE